MGIVTKDAELTAAIEAALRHYVIDEIDIGMSLAFAREEEDAPPPPPSSGPHTHHLATIFSSYPITLDHATVERFDDLVAGFETRGRHALALNSQLLGVYQMVFSDSDKTAFFDLFGVDYLDLAARIKKIPNAIISDAKVAGDPFSHLCVWLIHLAFVYLKNERVRVAFQQRMALYLHYRWFTSIVNRHFPHGANQGVMQATINSLSRRYDVVSYGTWRRALEARSADMVGKSSIHYKTFEKMDNDLRIIYVLSDMQTRLRSRVGYISAAYYEAHAAGTRLDTRSTTAEIDGDKVLLTPTSSFDTATSSVTTSILNIHAFLDRSLISSVARQFKITPGMMTQALTCLSTLASSQAKQKTLDIITVHQDKKQYDGVNALIRAFITASFRYCMLHGIDIRKKASVYLRVKEVYSASRVSDPDILAVKDSMGIILETFELTRRPATMSSLRLAVLMYILLLAMRHM